MHLNLSSSLILEHRGVVARARGRESVWQSVSSRSPSGPPRKWRTTPSQSQRMVFHPSVNTSRKVPTEYSHVTGTRYLTSVLVREYA